VIAKTGLVGEIKAETVSTISGQGAKEENGDPCWTGDEQHVPAIPDPDRRIDQTLATMKDDAMLQTIPPLIAQAREASPDMPRADIVNGLTLAYCQVELRAGELRKPHGRRRLNQFSLLVYSELVSNGHE
jgi:hypothetical protein